MNFEEILLQAVDEGLSTLGESCKQAVYFYLDRNFNLNKQEIPFRINDFAEAIENIFGVGGQVLEIRIMKNLFRNLGYPFPFFHENQCFEFTKYIESAKANICGLGRFKTINHTKNVVNTKNQT